MMKFSHRIVIFALVFVTFCFYLMMRSLFTSGNVVPYDGTVSHGLQCNNTDGQDYVSSTVNTHLLLQKLSSEHSEKRQNLLFEPSSMSASTTSSRKLKVYLMPHSHNDPGWLKTVGDYFSDQTEPTLTNMVKHLKMFPNMTFVWAESVFLSMWWDTLDSASKASTKELVKSGRLEIVGGGWVVPDEANPSLYALTNQLITGHQWLEEHLNVRPRNSWSLDPFGYSSTLPYIYKQAGFQNMVILRTHHRLKDHLKASRNLDFLWKQSWSSSNEYGMLTHMMPYKLYNIKHSCGPDQDKCLMFDFRKIPEEYSESSAETITNSNVKIYADILVDQLRKKSKNYRYDVISLPIGDDFRFDRDLEWDQQYENYVKLAQYINRNSNAYNMEMTFGTPSTFFEALRARIGDVTSANCPSLTGDFFPYSDKDDDYWTGYFTTRPYDKFYGRLLEQRLRAADILHSLANMFSEKAAKVQVSQKCAKSALENAHRTLGLFQHHDAITGTSRSYVETDYLERLSSAYNDLQYVIAGSAQPLVGDGVILRLEQDRFLQHMASKPISINIADAGSDVVFFNAEAQRREQLVHLLINVKDVQVRCNKDYVITSQLTPHWTGPVKASETLYELSFIVKADALAFVTYTITPVTSPPKHNYAQITFYNKERRVPLVLPFKLGDPVDDVIRLENHQIQLTFSPKIGMLQSVTSQGRTLQTKMQLMTYTSKRSGAYLFNPTGNAQDSSFYKRPLLRVVSGSVYSEVQVLQRGIVHSVRLLHTSSVLGRGIQIENNIDMTDYKDKEVILRFNTDLANNNVFFTDLNGFQHVKRQRLPHLPIQAQYYPMTSQAYIASDELRMTLLTAAPLGVSSQAEGALDVMLDRRPQYDDERGLGEGIYDTKPGISRFVLLLEQQSPRPPAPHDFIAAFPSALGHVFARDLNNPFLAMTVLRQRQLTRTVLPISRPLPCNLRVLTLRKLNNTRNLQVALILHKWQEDCHVLGALHACSDDVTTAPTFHELFDKLGQLDKVTNMTLSLMYELNNVDVNSIIDVAPMEVRAFKLHISSREDQRV